MPNKTLSTWAGIPYEYLSEDQKNLIEQILKQPNKSYFIKGVAGSGKTVLAAHIAKILSNKLDKNVGFTVFTKLLNYFIEAGFDKTGIELVETNQNLDTGHYHGLKDFWPANPYDVMIIDECQDFNLKMGKDVVDHSRYQIWLGDHKQQIYGEDNKYISDLERQFVNTDSTFYLSTNFRNSLYIAHLASYFLPPQAKKDFVEPVMRNERQVLPANNFPSVFIQCNNYNQEFEVLAEILKNICKTDEVRKHIAIVQLRNNELDKVEASLYHNIDSDLRNKLNIHRLGYRGEQRNQSIDQMKAEGALKRPIFTLISTIHSLKGLEFDYVIFMGTDRISFHNDNGDEGNDKLIHVLFSRAKRRIYTTLVNKDKCFVCKKIGDDLASKEYFQYINADLFLEEDAEQENFDEEIE